MMMMVQLNLYNIAKLHNSSIFWIFINLILIPFEYPRYIVKKAINISTNFWLVAQYWWYWEKWRLFLVQFHSCYSLPERLLLRSTRTQLQWEAQDMGLSLHFQDYLALASRVVCCTEADHCGAYSCVIVIAYSQTPVFGDTFPNPTILSMTLHLH